MSILSLPIELQERILVNIADDTKIELVCQLWNEICKKKIIHNLRFPCICLTSPHHAVVCKSIEHICICKEGPHHAMACNVLEHPCICLDDPDSVHHALRCRGDNHPCICNPNANFVINCRHTGMCNFI